MKQYNEKPSAIKNIGEDILGAKRHNFDTYENPELKAEKETKKRVKKQACALKTIAISLLNETNFKQVILDYEFNKTLSFFVNSGIKNCYNKENVVALKAYVIQNKTNETVKAFNKLVRQCSKINWNIRTLEDAKKYFEKRKTEPFTELNGIKKQWELTTKFDSSVTKQLESSVKAVQFGNSIPDAEREYCSTKLAESIVILKKYFAFDFKNIAFSYGARGLPRSIAHYQDSEKVLAFNRGWDGAMIHELGHAIDYALCMKSRELPNEVYSKYRAQLIRHEVKNQKYYLCKKEIFARLFEQYCIATIPELTEFMQFTFDSHVMPKLDQCAIEFMATTLKTILKG